MALTDVVFDSMSSEADRGNAGVLVDILHERGLANRLTLDMPLTTEVTTGVTFGPQDSLVGSFGAGAVPMRVVQSIRTRR